MVDLAKSIRGICVFPQYASSSIRLPHISVEYNSKENINDPNDMKAPIMKHNSTMQIAQDNLYIDVAYPVVRENAEEKTLCLNQ